jgi:CubicO group peptidase (beta-lactamase class C family)
MGKTIPPFWHNHFCKFVQIKYPIVKNSFLILSLLCLLYGCGAVSGKTEIVEDDSMHYYPPTPAKIDRKEFRQYYRTISHFFDSTLFRSGFNGGILIAKQGNVIFEKYMGKVDLRKEDSINANTPMHIASTGKTFTGIAILRLVQENRLSLTDTIQKFFPGLPYPGITVQMLLSHRSGLPNYVYFMDKTDWDKKKFIRNEDMLNVLYTGEPKRNFVPDTRFSYSNTNFVLLAMIIEKVTGLSFPEFMDQKFFKPLGMNNSFIFTPADTLTATPSFTASGTYWDFDFLDLTYGDKNLYSTPRDLLKWDQALYTDQVIRPSLLDSAFTPYSNERPSVHNYGLGWRLQILPNGKKIVYHFGRWHGFNAAFARLMDEQATIIILGNKFNRNIYRSALRSYDLFGPYFQDTTDEDDEEEVTRSPQTSPLAPVKK